MMEEFFTGCLTADFGAIAGVERTVDIQLEGTVANLLRGVTRDTVVGAVHHTDAFDAGDEGLPVHAEQEEEDAGSEREEPALRHRALAREAFGLAIDEAAEHFDDELEPSRDFPCPALRRTPCQEDDEQNENVRQQRREEGVGEVEILARQRAIESFTGDGDDRERDGRIQAWQDAKRDNRAEEHHDHNASEDNQAASIGFCHRGAPLFLGSTKRFFKSLPPVPPLGDDWADCS